MDIQKNGTERASGKEQRGVNIGTASPFRQFITVSHHQAGKADHRRVSAMVFV